MVGLGQAEAADDLAGRELRQIFAALRLGAVGIDRIHHQRGLHRHRRAVAGIDALELARDQAIGDIAEPGAAVFLRDGRAEQAELAHLGQHVGIVFLLAVGLDDARHQVVLRKAARGVAHHALFFGQLAFEIERIFPDEGRILQHCGQAIAFFGRLRHGTSLGLLAAHYRPLRARIRQLSANRHALKQKPRRAPAGLC